MKQYEEMSIKEKRTTLGEVYGLYNLYKNFEVAYDSLPKDLKEKLNNEFENNKPDELIVTLSTVVTDLYNIAEDLQNKMEQQNKEEEEEI